jgi:hypothetical protein
MGDFRRAARTATSAPVGLVRADRLLAVSLLVILGNLDPGPLQWMNSATPRATPCLDYPSHDVMITAARQENKWDNNALLPAGLAALICVSSWSITQHQR